MKLDTLPISHSIIDADDLGNQLINQYHLPEKTICELLHRGMNDFYLLRTRENFFVAQVWRANSRDFNQVILEMEFLNHLRLGGVNVPKPLANKKGEWGITIVAPDGLRSVAIFNFVEGKVFSSNPDLVISRRMGEIFAKIHKLSEVFVPKVPVKRIDRAQIIERNMPLVEKLVSHRKEDIDLYREVSVSLAAVYDASKDNDNIQSGLNHGDFHIHNAFVNKSEITIMDFDACGIDYYIQELMSYKWSIEKNNLPESLWENFISGYLSIRTFSESELKCIPIFLLGKEFTYLCGFSHMVNAIGHIAFHFPGLDWFSNSIRKHAKEAGIL